MNASIAGIRAARHWSEVSAEKKNKTLQRRICTGGTSNHKLSNWQVYSALGTAALLDGGAAPVYADISQIIRGE
jgi:hypothetical protein